MLGRHGFAVVALYASFTLASAHFLTKASGNPRRAVDIKRSLLSTMRGEVEGGDFTKGCLEVTKAVVAENDGSKKAVGSQLYLTCSGLEMPLDVDICESYRSTLLEHLRKSAAWNIKLMDYPLFCQAMEEVVKKQKAELAALQGKGQGPAPGPVPAPAPAATPGGIGGR